jgi:hypothetical protein
MRTILLGVSLSFSTLILSQVWLNPLGKSGGQFRCSVVDHAHDILYLAGGEILRYDGVNFDSLKSGIDDFNPGLSIVRSMEIFKNKLYVFGTFEKTGKYWCKNMGRWNGSDWDTIDFKPNWPILWSTVHNGELYVSGPDTIGGISCVNGIAKFDGTSWNRVDFRAGPMASFKGDLYGVGPLNGNTTQNYVLRYDGTTTTPLMGVTGDQAKWIYGLSVIDSMLFVYGRFSSIAGINCKGLGAYDGKRWYGFGEGLSDSGWQIIENVQKVGNYIYASGNFDKIERIGNSVPPATMFTTNLARYDGEKWCLISPPFDNDVEGLVEYHNEMFAYGAFRVVGQDSVTGFIKWNGGESVLDCSEIFTLTVSTVGMQEYRINECFKVFPNPVLENLTIQSSGLTEGQQWDYSVVNAIGSLITEGPINQDQVSIRCGEWAKGLYIMKLTLRGNRQTLSVKVLKE